jgi:hypothetical protein
METAIIQATYTGQQESAGDTDCLFFEQEKIPASQEQASMEDIYSMLAISAAGGSARSYISDSCPVTRAAAGGTVTASYTGSFLVHHSDGLEYELSASIGTLSEPQLFYSQKSNTINQDFKQVLQLEWLPLVTNYLWESSVYDQAAAVTAAPVITQENGFLYFDKAVFGSLRIWGTAMADRYRLLIDHVQGNRWTDTITITAMWGPENDRKRKSFELKLPQCVEDAFNECPTDQGSGGGTGGTGDHWGGVSVNPPKKIYFNSCTGEVLTIRDSVTT